MENNQLDKLLQGDTDGIDAAVKSIHNYYSGKFNPIKTSYTFLNELALGGLLPGLIISILGRPQNGKSYIVQQLREDILRDKSRNIGVLLYNLEMPWFSLLLVQMKKRLNKTFKDILSIEPTEEEIVIMKEIADDFRDHRLTTITKALTPAEWEYTTRKWIEDNLEEEQLFILYDHAGITKGTNKLEAIFELMERANNIKLDYANKVTFIILGQLNREIERLFRTRDLNPINLRVTSEYIYGSDALQQYSDIIISSTIPQRFGLEKYCSVNKERNPHLEEHILDEDKHTPKDYVRLKGLNRIYYDVLKTRLNDDTPTLYCEILNEEQEEFNLAVQQYEKDHTPEYEDDDLAF